jgi:GTP cyclohydrolase I
MTSEIASAVQQSLQPQGVGVVLKATHHCMSSRGVHKTGAEMVTSCMLGCFRDNPSTRQEFLAIANQP